MNDQDLYVLLLKLELVIPQARSLKQKRGPLQSLKQRIRGRFNVSVSEVGYRDKWQRALLAACMVGGERRHLESEAAKLCQLVEETSVVELARVDREWL